MAVDPEPAVIAPDGRWHPGIGDPTLAGWVTVAAYGAAAALCAACAMKALPAEARARRFWTGFALVLLFLGVNKELDLQSWMTEVGRDLARAQGWYASRRVVQFSFIAALALGGAAALALLYRHVRDAGPALRRALLGLVLLSVFILVRAASFHHFDVLISVELGGYRVFNLLLELGGTALIASGAAMQLRRPAPA